jgi:hypothetical protein
MTLLFDVLRPGEEQLAVEHPASREAGTFAGKQDRPYFSLMLDTRERIGFFLMRNPDMAAFRRVQIRMESKATAEIEGFIHDRAVQIRSEP